jgi:hypothetical protein
MYVCSFASVMCWLKFQHLAAETAGDEISQSSGTLGATGLQQFFTLE